CSDAHQRRDPRAYERQSVSLRRLSEHRRRGEACTRSRPPVMKAFAFERVAGATDATHVVAARRDAMFLAGGTTLVDLMKIDVLTPDTVVPVRPLGMSKIDVLDDGLAIGANATNSQVAWHPVVRDRYPVLAEAILAGATTQLRNMA